MSRELMNEDNLDQVVGGFMHFNPDTKVLTYTHEETGEVKQYQILMYNRAWGMSNALHAKNLHEDEIISKMLSDGCIC